MVATIILLGLVPTDLPIACARKAIEGQSRGGSTSEVGMVATMRLLFNGPQILGAFVAIEGITARTHLLTAVFLLASRPILFPSLQPCIAIIGDQSRSWTTLLLVTATPSHLFDRPASPGIAKTEIAIVSIALCQPFTTTEFLLGIIPACLPVGGTGRAIEGHWAGLEDTT